MRASSHNRKKAVDRRPAGKNHRTMVQNFDPLTTELFERYPFDLNKRMKRDIDLIFTDKFVERGFFDQRRSRLRD